MSISKSRSLLCWTPLIGWALLACSVTATQAQAQAPESTDQSPGGQPGGASPTAPLSPITPGVPTIVAPTGPVVPGVFANPAGPVVSGPAAATGTPPARSPVASPGIYGVPTSPVTTVMSSGVSPPSASGITSPYGGSGYTSEELGITWGAFRLYPTLDIQAGVDNNVFAQSQKDGPRSSPTLVVQPSLELRSQWLNHQLRVLLAGGLGYYSQAPTQNYQNYTLTVDGKLEILEDFYLTPSVSYKRATEALGTPNTAFASTPTVVDTVPVKLGIYQRFNRFFYEAAGTATRFWHYDYSTLAGSGLSGSQRDRVEYDEQIRLGYEISDDISLLSVASGPQLRDRDHRRKPGRGNVGAHRQCGGRGLSRRSGRQ